MAESIPSIPRVWLGWLKADATLDGLTPIGTEYRTDGTGAPLVPFLLGTQVSAPQTSSNLPEYLVGVQLDVFAGSAADAQTIVDRVLWLVENEPYFDSVHGRIRGVLVINSRNLSDLEADGRYRLTMDLSFTIQRPD